MVVNSVMMLMAFSGLIPTILRNYASNYLNNPTRYVKRFPYPLHPSLWPLFRNQHKMQTIDLLCMNKNINSPNDFVIIYIKDEVYFMITVINAIIMIVITVIILWYNLVFRVKNSCKFITITYQTCQEYTMERPVKTNTEDDPNTSQKFVLHASQQQSGKLNSHNLTNGSDTQHDSRKDNHQHLLLAEAYSSSDTSKPSTQNESKTTEVHANLKEKNSGTKDNTSSQQSSNIVSNVSQPSTKMEDKQQSNRGCYRQLFHSSNSPISSTEELYNKSQTQTKE